MLYLGALPSAFRLRDLLKQAFVSFSQYLGMETQMRSCDTTNSVCPQGLSQVASLCADKIMKFANGTRTAGYVSYCNMDWAMLCSYKLIICWVIPLCFGLWFLVLYCYVKGTWAKAKGLGPRTKGHGSRTKEQGTNTSSVLDYPQFDYGFVTAIHRRCCRMVLADGACGLEKEICLRNKRIIDVALICRRVGSKRVKVLSSRKRRCSDHSSSCRQEALLQITTFVLHACICSCYFYCGVRACDESEYIDPCE